MRISIKDVINECKIFNQPHVAKKLEQINKDNLGKVFARDDKHIPVGFPQTVKHILSIFEYDVYMDN